MVSRYFSTEKFLLPVVAGVIAALSLALVVIGVYFTYRRWKGKQYKHHDSSPELTSSPLAFHTYNPKISQSTPNIASQCASSLPEFTEEEEQIGKSTYKTVIKQTTMPIVPQRHLSFQRQLTNKLELANSVDFEIHSVKYREQPQKIKPELYRQNAQENLVSRENSIQQSEVNICGKLHYSLKYLHEHNSLVVDILKAEDLPAKDFSGTSDPYVKVYLLPDRKNKHQTKVHRKTLNPVFDEQFLFPLAYTELHSRTLQFSVYDFDRFSRHDLIGVVIMKDLMKSKDLAWEQCYTADIISVQQENVDLGDLLLSLCYLPTAGRLTVTIIKARDLKAMDITGTSDPYVKVSLMCHNRRIKKKKTSVKKSTLNPVYNEAIMFDVPQENIDEVALIIKVIDYDRVGSNELMGGCTVGPSSVGIGRDHWFEMLENSRKPVAQWYTLQENIPGGSHDHTPNGKRDKQDNKVK